MKSFRVLDRLNHDGKRYGPGDTVKLDADTADHLVDAGVVAPPSAPDAEQPPPRTELLREAVNAMLAEDPERAQKDWWLNDGRPEARELARRVGFDVSAKERDALWAEMGGG